MMKILFAKDNSNSNSNGINASGFSSGSGFNSDNNNLKNLKLNRNEIISFVNLVGKVSKSLKYFYEAEKKEKLKTFIRENGGRGEHLKLFTIFYTSLVMFLIMFTNNYFLKNRNKLEKKVTQRSSIINRK